MEEPQIIASTDSSESKLRNLIHSVCRQTRVLPNDSTARRPLLVVISVMCFLAALSAGGVLAVNRITQEWTTGLESSLTIQLKTQPGLGDISEAAEIQLKRIIDILENTKGILSVTPISRDEAARLLEPWLGAEIFAEALPVPQLIDVRFEPDKAPNLRELETKISKVVPEVKLQDHNRWNDRILTFADFLRALAFSIMALIALTTIAIIVFATRAGLATQHEIVEVLHLIGAQDKFIAREFQFELLALGLRASLFGAGVAILTLLLAPHLSGAFSDLPGAYLISPISLTGKDLINLLLVPVIACAVIVITTRITVLHVLSKTL